MLATHDHAFSSASVQSQPAISVPLAIVLGLIASFIQSLGQSTVHSPQSTIYCPSPIYLQRAHLDCLSPLSRAPAFAGLTIQRKSHLLNERAPADHKRTEWRRPLWIIGFVIFLCANIGGTVFQIGALPIVMLAPLGAVSLLYNALLARFLLNDFFSKYMVLGECAPVREATLFWAGTIRLVRWSKRSSRLRNLRSLTAPSSALPSSHRNRSNRSRRGSDRLLWSGARAHSQLGRLVGALWSSGFHRLCDHLPVGFYRRARGGESCEDEGSEKGLSS